MQVTILFVTYNLVTSTVQFFSFLFFLRSLFQVYWGERLSLRRCLYLESSLFFLLCNCAELSPPILDTPPSFPQSSQVTQWAFYYLFSSCLIFLNFSISGYLFYSSYNRSISLLLIVIHSSFIISRYFVRFYGKDKLELFL
jgi:hypothetical protein